HIAWRDNRTIARAKVDGRPGIYALAVDPANNGVFASSVGRLPGATGQRAPAVSHVSFFTNDASGDTVNARATSDALGDYMAGGPAVDAKAGPDGRRLVVVPLPANDSLAVLDASTGSLVRKIALGVEPIAAVVSSDSRVAYVTVLGGAKPKAGQRTMKQCCDA